jgi:hypothetical protein
MSNFRDAHSAKEIIPSIPYTVFSYLEAAGGVGVLGAEYPACQQVRCASRNQGGPTVENYVATGPVYGEGLCAERLHGSKGVGILANDKSGHV